MSRPVLILLAIIPLLTVSQAHAICSRGTDESTLSFRFRCQVTPVLDDVVQIVVEGPKYLAKRLPAMQAMGQLEGQMDLLEPGQISLHLAAHTGLYRNFDSEVASEFKKIPKKGIASVLPLPAATLGFRIGINPDVELGARYSFIPAISTNTEGFEIAATTTIYGAHARYRLYQGTGGAPSLIGSARFTYFTGFMEIGRDIDIKVGTVRDAELNAELNAALGSSILGPNDPVKIGARFTGAPIIGWDIFQVSGELRAVWDFGPVHPLLGGGLDAAGGHVDSGSNLALDSRIIGPKPVVELAESTFEDGAKIADVIEKQKVTFISEKPRSVGARLIAGIEFDLGDSFRLPIEGQFDLTSGSFVTGLGVRYVH